MNTAEMEAWLNERLEEQSIEERAREEARTRAGETRIIPLWLSADHEARIRPLCLLFEGVKLWKHSFWENGSFVANAFCAQEVGQPCKLCADAKTTNNRKLNAKEYLYLPVWVYDVTDTATGKQVVNRYKDNKGNSVERRCENEVRVLELGLSGPSFVILAYFRDFTMKSASKGQIFERDFTIKQLKSGTDKDFLLGSEDKNEASEEIIQAVLDYPRDIIRQGLLNWKYPEVDHVAIADKDDPVF